MPLYYLKFKCDLENVSELSFREDTLFKLDVESESGERRDGITFCTAEETELTGSKGTILFIEYRRNTYLAQFVFFLLWLHITFRLCVGTANFVMKWDKTATHQAYIKVVSEKKFTGKYLSTDSGTKKTMLCLECRGLVPVRWVAGVDLQCVTASGKRFNEVDLTDGDWADYDDEADEAVSITNAEHSFERA